MKYSGIGGQAVMEGVMMKNKDHYAVAVRKPDGNIEVKKEEFKGISSKCKLFRVPFIRGIFSFIDSLTLGMSTLTYSASFYDEEEDTKKTEQEKKKSDTVFNVITIMISVILAVGIFMVVPFYLSQLLEKVISSKTLVIFLEGVIRLLIFIIYIVLISLMKDIKRVYMYHGAEQRFAFLRWYFGINQDGSHSKSIAELKRYYDWAIIGVNHEDIVAVNVERYSDARNRFQRELESNMLFRYHYETAYRWLLRQNIKQDNLYSDRKFDFNIEYNRSLEHVYPKSKIGHKNDQNIALGWNDEPIKDECSIALWREEMEWTCKEDHHIYNGSEHCIGNLVLLYKRDNSKFNDADFRKKNQYFFTDQDDESFKSRHLIHTTMVFSDVNWEDKISDKPWNKEQVPMRKYAELKEFENEYPEIYNKTN